MNLSLSQFPILSNPNQRAPPPMKSADPCPPSTTPMEVDQSTNMRETALREGSSKEKSASSRSNQPFFFFLFEADFIQLVVLNLSHLNYIKLCLFLTSNKR